MATTPVDICNSALSKIGADFILELTDDNKRARLCNHQYPILRDELLRAHPWNFAITRKELAEIPTAPVFEFEKMYGIPDDVLRILKTDLNLTGTISETKWAVETDLTTNQKVLVTNAESVKIKYLRRITDVTKYDSIFVEVLAARIAADLAYPLVQSGTLSQQLFALYQQLLRDARSFDAQEGSLDQVEAFDWLNARF